MVQAHPQPEVSIRSDPVGGQGGYEFTGRPSLVEIGKEASVQIQVAVPQRYPVRPRNVPGIQPLVKLYLLTAADAPAVREVAGVGGCLPDEDTRNDIASKNQVPIDLVFVDSVEFAVPAVGLEGLRRKACTNQEGGKDNKEMFHQFHLSENIFIPQIYKKKGICKVLL